MPPDETATESAPTGGDNATSGSEFSKPVGVEDDALWAKHFGGDGEEKPKKPKADSKERPTRSDSKPSKPTPAVTDGKSEKPSTPKDTKSDKSTSTKKDTSASPTDEAGKTEKETDPEAPTKKARDLFEAAKKTEDRREARKLYKQAMKTAFGEVPEEFDDKRYAAARTETAARKAALDEQAKKNETRINDAATRLKPAIYVMRQLEGAKLADQLTVPMVERAISVMRALKSLEDGDFTQLAEVVAKASGVDHDEAMRRFVKGVKVTPEGKAARQAAEDARREAAETRAQLQALQRQLEDKQTTETEAQKKQRLAEQQTQAREQWLDDIETELEGHPVLSLTKGKERVLEYLIKTRHPTLKTPRFTKEQAADRVVAHEKRRLEGSRHLLDDGEAPPARSAPRRIESVSRSSTADTGVRSQDPMARFDEIFDKHRAPVRRAR